MEQKSKIEIKTRVEAPGTRSAKLHGSSAAPASEHGATLIDVDHFSFYYGENKVLHDISLSVMERRVTALIGPSGCGKSTLLRMFNRMNDLIPQARSEGDIRMHGQSILKPTLDVIELRRRVGMVFQKSNPFPKTIFDNVAFGLRMLGVSDRATLSSVVEKSLRQSALWDEVKDHLDRSALALSGGQQQRLCIARALAVNPEVLLMDEPCSALDPIATGRIEELIYELKAKYTIIIVTHNMQQAARVSDETGFLYMGKLIEVGPTDKLFTNPENPMTESYITGRFG